MQRQIPSQRAKLFTRRWRAVEQGGGASAPKVTGFFAPKNRAKRNNFMHRQACVDTIDHSELISGLGRSRPMGGIELRFCRDRLWAFAEELEQGT